MTLPLKTPLDLRFDCKDRIIHVKRSDQRIFKQEHVIVDDHANRSN